MRLVSKHMQGSCPRLVDETTEELIATGADDINDKLRDANKYHRTVHVEVHSYLECKLYLCCFHRQVFLS